MPSVFDVLGQDHQEVKRMLAELETGPDGNAVVPGGVRAGVGRQLDRARGLVVTSGGVTVVG